MKKRTISDNFAYDDIENFIKEDLSYYSQDNEAPSSKTVVLEDGTFRHYELGPIIGYVLFGKIEENEIKTMISQIQEDDSFWFAPNTPMYMAGAWLPYVKKTLNNMNKWYNEHIFEGFVKGEWKSYIKKEIVDEEIW